MLDNTAKDNSYVVEGKRLEKEAAIAVSKLIEHWACAGFTVTTPNGYKVDLKVQMQFK